MTSATSSVTTDEEVQQLEEAYAAPAFTPTLMVEEETAPVEADWAIVAAVAAILAVAVAIVLYICGVCQARSFNACYRAVINYWGRGC